MKTDIGPVFRELERDTERISAYLRLVIAAALAILLLTTDSLDPDNRLDIVLGGYAAVAVLAIGLAYRRYFRHWLPWFFVTLDVAILSLLMAAPARSMGVAPAAILSLPMASLIFVMLAAFNGEAMEAFAQTCQAYARGAATLNGELMGFVNARLNHDAELGRALCGQVIQLSCFK